jgi:transcriptional regulator with XRE-family HTH domain
VQESLAKKLRVFRADKGITLDEAEKLTGVTRETIGALEHAQRGAQARTLEKIARGYDVPVEYLVSSGPALPRTRAREPALAEKDEAPETERETIENALDEVEKKLEEIFARLNSFTPEQRERLGQAMDAVKRRVDGTS